MISNNTIKKIIRILFLDPQKILGGNPEQRKLDCVHLISIKLLSGTPIKGRGCKIDPILIKIGFSNIDEDQDICSLSENEIFHIFKNLKKFDSLIGSWTLIHDIPATETRPQWRMSSEISSLFLRSGKIEKTDEENPKNIFCIDIEGVGIFMGKPKNKEEL